MLQNEKRCKKCQKILPLDAFYPSKRGYRSMCKQCCVQYSKDWRRANLDKARQIRRKSYQKHRNAVLTLLSEKGKPKCAICGFDNDPRLLQVDHVNNDGAQEQRRLSGTRSGGTDKLYRFILKQPPEEARKRYRVLCAFHNWCDKIGITGNEYKVVKEVC